VDLDSVLNDLGIGDAIPNETPEQKLYRDLTTGKPYPKFPNCIYWLKHELRVYNHLIEKTWHVSKPNGATRLQVSYKDLARAFLEYYFLMVYLPYFEGEDALRRGVAVNMERFLDIVMEDSVIKKVLDDPTKLI
jgi:hypothetical protein